MAKATLKTIEQNDNVGMFSALQILSVDCPRKNC